MRVRELLKPRSGDGGRFRDRRPECPEISGVYPGVAGFLLVFGWETYGFVVVRRLTSFWISLAFEAWTFFYIGLDLVGSDMLVKTG